MRRFAILAALAGAAATATPAFANDWRSTRLDVPRAEWLSPTQIGEKLTGQGYKVHKIESDDGAYEVEMTDKAGMRIDAHVHPATGELLVGYDD